MYVWLALLIPIIAVWITYSNFKHKVAPAEIFIPVIAVFLVIIPFKLFVETSQTNDIEFLSNPIVSVRYEQPYATWHVEQCSKTYDTGSGKQRRSHTVYYDCSKCLEYGPSYFKIDSKGNEYSIGSEEYKYIVRLWNTGEHFVELNRDINYHNPLLGSACGKDGDAYISVWDKNPLTALAVIKEHTYENRIHAAHTVFEYKKLSPAELKRSEVHDYPSPVDGRMNSILGCDKFSWYKEAEVQRDIHLLNYIDGKYGPLRQCKTFVCLFKNKPISSAFAQEAYWEGGNKNEFVLCIGIDSVSRKLLWVKSFGWSTNKLVHVDAREEIMNQEYYNFYQVFKALDVKVLPNFKRKEFAEFNYITIEPPFWSIVTIFIISIVISIGTCIYIVKNDIN